MATEFLVEAEGDVAVVRLAGTSGNVLDAAVLRAGAKLARDLATERPAALVVTGGDRFFCAGLDLKALSILDKAGQREVVAGFNEFYAAWYALPFPVIGALSGHAVAGGLVLALCTDYRVGSVDGYFGLSEVRVGVAMPIVVDAICRAELPAHAARVLLLGGELVDAATALRLGVLDETVGEDVVVARAVELARARAELPRAAYADLKEQQRGGLRAQFDDWNARQSDPALTAWFGPETAAAAAAILRTPAERRNRKESPSA
ncbi:enoyl-CoA hydratase/isomerase family protein [Nocardia sp. NPDC059177]|uniref:enoyl-CoA hydratase/isomerase family protein n=1 Tax=Nocardia sp. NPDC059177 TaxID=3346759 RepID=UPI0036BA0B9B